MDRKYREQKSISIVESVRTRGFSGSGQLGTKQVLPLLSEDVSRRMFNKQCWCRCRIGYRGNSWRNRVSASFTMWSFHDCLRLFHLIRRHNQDYWEGVVQIYFILLSIRNCECTSATCSLTPAQSSKLNSNSDKRRHHCASFPCISQVQNTAQGVVICSDSESSFVQILPQYQFSPIHCETFYVCCFVGVFRVAEWSWQKFNWFVWSF